MTVRDTDKGYARFMRAYGQMRASRVVVGIRQDKGSVRGKDGDTVAEYATKNEFGRPASQGRPAIPERSFMRSTFDEQRKKYIRVLTARCKRILDAMLGKLSEGGGSYSVEKNLGLVGAMVVGDIQRKIRRGPFVPNAPYTIRKKKSSKPLIDTGRMRQSIDWEVRGAPPIARHGVGWRR